MYEAQTFEAIMERMLSMVSDDLDKREGSIIYDALAPEALELARTYVELDNILSIVFARTTYGEFLDLIAESHGVTRKEAEAASGYVWIEGTANFKNAAPVEIKVDIKEEILKFIVVDEDNNPIDVQLPDTGRSRYKVLCNVAGTKGNIPSNSIELTEYIPGIDKIYNTEAFTTGLDEESDSSLLQRLLEKVKNPPSSGNKTDYIRWAKEVPGVESVKVIPLWNGPGTVKLILLGKEGMPVTESILNNVKLYIDPQDGKGEGTAPIGASVTIVTVRIKNVIIEVAGLVVKDSYNIDSVKQAIKDNLTAYLEKILPGDVVILKSVEAVVMSTDGVFDFTQLKINGDISNLITNDEEKVVFQEVIFIE